MQALLIELGALALLIFLLCWSCAQRLRQQGKYGNQMATTPGHGFDAMPVKQRLDRLRQDHGTAAQRIQRTPTHDLFVAAIRDSVRQLAYFHPTPPGNADDANPDPKEILP
jgi:hypothetical protein